VQLSCDYVRRYQPEPSQETEAMVARETPAYVEPVKSRRLIISISQTPDAESDIAYLNKLVDTLRGFPGEDEVKLCIVNGDRVVNLKLSNIYTNYCPELHQRLVELVGEEGLKMETNG